VQVFVPGDGSACLECGWGREDYRQLSQEYPCVPGASAEAPADTRAGLSGGSDGERDGGRSSTAAGARNARRGSGDAFDLLHRRQLVSRLRHNPRCRFNHEVVRECLTLDRVTAADLLGFIRARLGPETLFSPGRHAAAWAIRPASHRPGFFRAGLACRGRRCSSEQSWFDPHDLPRVRTGSGSFFVRLSQ